MRTNLVRALVLIAGAVAVAAAAAAQEGHPLAGTWYGEYVAGTQKRDVTVVMTWDGKAVTGLINPGPDARPLKTAALTITPGKPAPEGQNSTTGTPPVFQVRFEVDGMTFDGTIQNPVAGNRRITGTWSRGNTRGAFQIRRL
jgi:opacity protein-like surface antigen